ncbi:collagen-like triple helix repeat-containing protein [Fulvivirga sedimenti]|jgi:hypothetical protein|uniref:Collagen-like protein n=1 Tax=Fulvivirga sedimenti TaxID=2879465 RepID=A0A9X1L2K2_9BACT|nr:collagen-like protein [Fulvivirga sedimenti]MCA6078286.1 collagen-like protein [Fulvivirga sedimenti]
MKKLIPFLLVIVTIVACEGPEGPIGPRGPQGAPGEDGVNIESFVFEYEVDFRPEDDYTVFLSYLDDFVALPSDVTMVYFLWGQTEIDGELVDIWRALPQTVFTDNGLIQYNYDFTRYDVSLFLNTDFDPDLLQPIDTDDWIVRVVVIPGQFVTAGGKMAAIDFNDYYAVMEAMGVENKTVAHEYNNSLVRR